MRRLTAFVLAVILSVIPFSSSFGGVVSASSSIARQLIFDDRETFEVNQDFVMGGAYRAEHVSLSTEADHTTGEGKSLRMGNRTALYNRVKLENIFLESELGNKFTVTAWVYSKDEAAPGVSIGAYGAAGTAYATSPAAYAIADVPPNTWTKLEMAYEHANGTVTQLGIDQRGSAGTSIASTLFIDDITVTQTGGLLPFETRVTKEGRRPIPVVADTGKGYEDLIFYDREFNDDPETEVKDPETMFNELPPGRVVKNQNDLINASVTGPQYGQLDIVPVTGMPFTTAWQAEVISVPENPWDYQLVLDNMAEDIDYTAGDNMLLVFYMRTLDTSREDGTGLVQTIVEMDQPPNSKALAENVATLAGQGWLKVYLPFVAKAGYPRLCIRLGYHLQTVQFGGYELINYENQVTFDKLPSSSIMKTTDGRGVFNKNEAWRIDAWDRIEQIRKGDIHIAVYDQNGNPVEGAQVDVNMAEHEFKWGSAINANLLANDLRGVRSKAAVASLFNSAVLEGEHKWVAYENNPQQAADLVDAAASLGLKSLRGHTLIWDRSFPNGWTPNSSIPQDLAEMLAQDDRAGLEARIRGHFQSILQSSPNVISEWDVLNETLSNRAMREAYGNIIIKDWFQWAREYAPQAKLYINETGIIGLNPPRVATFKTVLNSMVDNQVDFDGIGIQGHIGDNYTDMEDVYADLMEVAAYGKEMKITEFDMGAEISKDREYESSFTRDMMIMSFSMENMNGFYMWGFYSGMHWLKNAPILNADWTLKASGEQYLDLVYNKWWTDESGVTESDGTYSTRGFYGDYDITVTVNGKATTVESQVYKGQSSTIEIVLED
ncbi:MAG: Beta,4-xylanase [Paenibacillaceae bacterium]|jgi:GH35 family endo-1,4-beta-xylanase|nr:Beta,4-xylanase [Paenibacillaceae bacterium]